MDIHNRNHPDSRHGSGNGLSVGFTSHYARMRATDLDAMVAYLRALPPK